MLDILQVSVLLKLGTALVALALIFAVLYALDRRYGFSFKRWISRGDDPDSQPIERYGVSVYLAARFLGICILIGLLLGCQQPAYALGTDKYDAQIEDAAETWLPGVPWKLLKAQYYQESHLKPDARSYVGAAGIAQFMPKTWEHVAAELGWPEAASPHDADLAIVAGAYYMATLRKGWRDLKDWERHNHAMASYNAGPGNIRKAWRRAGKTGAWDDTAAKLPTVTGRHAKETQGYVRNIWRWYAAL